MPPINFPSNPQDGDIFEFGGRVWIYDAQIPAWIIQASTSGAPVPLILGSAPSNGSTVPSYPAQVALVSGVDAYICVNFASRIWKLITGSGGGGTPSDAILFNGDPILYNGDYILYN